MYTFDTDRMGTVFVYGPDEKLRTVLFGDDARKLLGQLAHAEFVDFPSGPFETVEELQSAILGDYSGLEV